MHVVTWLVTESAIFSFRHSGEGRNPAFQITSGFAGT
jgi:hypothetical protein